MKQEEIKTYRQITELTGWEKNPRSISKEGLERLKKQIKKLGQYKPLIITEEGIVIGGNMRLKAYKELGLTDIWVSIIHPKNDNEMLEYSLSDNDRAGTYDEDLLLALAEEYDIEWDDYAIDMGNPLSIQDLLTDKKEAKEDEPPAVDEENIISQPGEMYQLGKHFLLCGDATNIADVEKLMQTHKADMIFTDPPYNIDYEGKTKKQLKIQNDAMEDTAFYEFLYTAFLNMQLVSKSGAAAYICHAESEWANFRRAFIAAGFLLKQCIIWNKNAFVLGRQDYHWKHEPILYGWNKGGNHVFYGGRNKTTVWDISRPNTSREHPTMKPIALMVEALKNSSKSEDIILDTFAGSGSTLIACEQTGRICYSMELDPKYCDVIRKRYAKFIEKEEQWQEVTPKIS